MNKLVYMDYHATTPVDREVLDAMLPYFSEKFGNASSRQHQFGWEAEGAVETWRATIARLIGADTREIVFTSGATEANNLAIKGVAEACRHKGRHIVTLQTEHKSVLDSCKALEKHGFQVTYLSVDSMGLIKMEDLERVITPATILVSVMLANNEIGVLQPVAEIGKLCHLKGVLFHTDATQAVGKVPVNVQDSNIDLMAFSGHKFYGPKGVGALYVRNANPKVKLAIQLDGGGHERGMRSGTLNVPGIVGLGKALQLSTRLMPEESMRVKSLRDKMFSALLEALSDVYLNGHPVERLPNNLNVYFAGAEANTLMLSMKEVALSTGSACSTGNPEPSHVLKALRFTDERAHSSLRFGLGRYTTEEEVDYVVDRVVESVRKLRSFSNASRNVKEPAA